MWRVMVTCPETGKAVFTGLITRTRATRPLHQSNFVGCPHCGDLHDWQAKDCWFETNRPPQKDREQKPAIEA